MLLFEKKSIKILKYHFHILLGKLLLINMLFANKL